MQKKLSIQLVCSEETLNRAVVMLTGKSVNQEIIDDKFCCREEPVVINLDDLFNEQESVKMMLLVTGYMVNADNKEDAKEAFGNIFKPNESVEQKFRRMKEYLYQKTTGHLTRWSKWIDELK